MIEGIRVKSLRITANSKKDLLSQWRGYANDGGGVALGFGSSAIKMKNGFFKEEHEIRLCYIVVDYYKKK